MGIKINYRKLPIEPIQALSIVQNETDRFGTFINLERVLYHEARYQREASKLYPEFRNMAGDPSLVSTHRDDVARVLVNRFGVPAYRITNKKGNLSVSKKILKSLLEDGELSDDARHFIGLYQEVSSKDYMASYLGQYSRLPLSKMLDMDNQRMVIAHPWWELLATSRISGSRPSVQNVNRAVCDIYTAPKGWQVVFSDSGQIEPRITYSVYIQDDLIKYLILLYDDAYFGLLHYITMTPQEEEIARRDLSAIRMHEITPAMVEKRQRLKVLGLAGNYGSVNLAAVDQELGPIYERKIVRHKARLELEAKVTEQVRRGCNTFHAYFGTPITPKATEEYAPGDSGWQGHLIRCGINNPIQTTASELMCISVMEAKKILGPDDHIGSYKHDEGMFYVKEDHVDVLAPKLRDCLSYDVEGWIPIGSDLHIGRKESPYVSNLY